MGGDLAGERREVEVVSVTEVEVGVVGEECHGGGLDREAVAQEVVVSKEEHNKAKQKLHKQKAYMCALQGVWQLRECNRRWAWSTKI